MEQCENLDEVFDAHVYAEFIARDIDATMATMVDAPYVTHVPVMTGGCGRDDVRRFYSSYFIDRWPADTQLKPVVDAGDCDPARDLH
jgi:carboxymethylenebutenolidase